MKVKEKFVVDTNIIVYSIDRNSKYYNFSKGLIDDNEIVYITTKSISEFVFVLSKMDLYDIVDYELINLINHFKILYPNIKSIQIFSELIKKYKPIGNRVFDIVIVSIMKSYGIRKIATINKKDFGYIQDIEIITF